MSQSKPGRPVLTVCPTCKLAYAPEKNPKGCPYCAQNPDLGRITREHEQEERARQGTVWPMVQGWFANTTVRLGAVVLTVVVIGITIWFWYRGMELTGARSEGLRSELIRNECLRTDVAPGSPELAECVRAVEAACPGMPLGALTECAREITEPRFRQNVLER